MSKNTVLIFSDGASRGNPGRGGYGAIVVTGESSSFSDKKESGNFDRLHVKELGGREVVTTNNRMELEAVISGLKYYEKSKIEGSSIFHIYTDSKYVVNGSTAWVFGWAKNGWKTASGDVVKNQDLWESMSELIKGKKIDWILLPGHAGVEGNEICDQIATGFADDIKPELFNGKLSDYTDLKILDVFYNPDLIKEAKDDKKKNGASKSSSSSAKAYSYVSKVGGVISYDKSWADCEKKVKGQKGVLFKKAVSLADQEKITKDFMSR
ncbi:MAG: ribonuclease H [bacterium]